MHNSIYFFHIMIRAKRNKISLIDKNRLVEAHKNGDDWRTLSEQLGINVRSAENIISKFKKTGEISAGKWGGHKSSVIDAESGHLLYSFVEDNNLATLAEMKAFLNERCNINPSRTTISRFLDNKCLSIKLVRDVPAERNSEHVFSLCYEYA